MILNIEIRDKETIEVDTNNLPLGIQFESLLETFDEFNVSIYDLHRVAMLYYRNGHPAEFSKAMLSIVNNLVFDEAKQSTYAAIYDAYLLMCGKEMKYTGEAPVFDVLKGVVRTRKNELKAAQNYFKSCNFVTGIEVVDFLSGKKKQFSNKILNFLRQYFDGNSRFVDTSGVAMSDPVRYRIDSSFSIEEKSRFKNNKDVLATEVESKIGMDNGEAVRLLSEIEDCDIKFFLEGKIYHLNGDYDNAVIKYEQSNCFLAKYNKSRIQQNEFVNFKEIWDGSIKVGTICDFSCFLARKFGIDVRIECELKNVYDAIERPCLYNYRRLIGNKYVEEWTVLNNIAFELWKDMDRITTYSNSFKPLYEAVDEKKNEQFDSNGEKNENSTKADGLYVSFSELECNHRNFGEMLNDQTNKIIQLYENVLKVVPDEYKMVIEGNLRLVKDSVLKQALMKRDRNEIEMKEDEDLLKYYDHLTRVGNTTGDLYYAFNCIDKYFADKNEHLIETAMRIFLKSDSVYAINGIAIIYIVKKKYKQALPILKRLCLELPLAYINLGNLYILMEMYEEALSCFRCVPLSNYTYKMMNLLCSYCEVDF